MKLQRLLQRFTGRTRATPPPASRPYGWAECLAFLRRQGFAPRRILDVGANHSAWTRAAITHFPSASYLLVEPQDWLKSHAQDLMARHDVRWISAGVSDAPGTLQLTVAPDDTSSNFGLTAEEAAGLGLRQIPVPVRTIDEIVRSHWGAPPEMAKIDAEGFDLKALAGATELLGKTDVLFIEAVVCAPRVDNTMAAVMQTMTGHGYQLVDITDINRSPRHGVLWLCELVFLRQGCGLLAGVDQY